MGSLVGNACEHVTSVWMACKGKMELTIGVSVGSSIQIAAGMIPLLVIIAWPLNKDLTLFFVSTMTKLSTKADQLRDDRAFRIGDACKFAAPRWQVENT